MRARPERPLAGLVVLLIGGAGGYFAGESPSALLLGMIFGAAAALIGWQTHFSPEPAHAARGAADLRADWPHDVMSALAEPMLLLKNGRVSVANAAAKQLLGDWIEGHDVRLAIRHPATLELLARSEASADPLQHLEVAGLGQADRRWLMRVAALEDGSRFVHLSDRSDAAAAERMRVDFVANASHELRTPLATIIGFAETLQEDGVGEKAELRARFLKLMESEAKRMQQLVEDLMSLSRIEAERFNPPRDAVDLLSIVEEIRAGCAHLLAERKNSLVVDARCSSAVVAGDRGQLLQLLRNLVVNAVKYGKAESEVTIRFEDDEPLVLRMTVIDRGEGIAPEHLPRLTERFYRVDAGRSRSVGGTGLGLAIVKHIVGRHRGGLDIKSVVGEGTAVSITLPRLEPVS